MGEASVAQVGQWMSGLVSAGPAHAADWAPISMDGRLHDRASYRYFWQTLERAHQTGAVLPSEAQAFFAPLPC